jgi:3-oxoacyl-[acyl-carrier-protein] synthase II
MNVVIAGADAASAYGWSLDALWDGLLSGQTPIRSADRFSDRGFISDQMALVPDLQIDADESRVMAMLRKLLAPLAGKLDPLTPLILATTVGEIEYVERAVLNDSPELAQSARPQVLLEKVKQLLALRGPAMFLSSACASSSAALTRAASMIRHEQAQSILVVSCDAVSEFVYSGFSTLLSLCEGPARPFDAARSGLTLGEGAAWALLASDQSPLADGWKTAVAGWGNTTDAVHMTAPHRQAAGLTRAITKACAMAHCTAPDIAFIAAHGTATIFSDAMELLAMSATMDRPKPIFSIKGGTGHTLAAAGLMQILVAARALSLGVVPPTVGLRAADPAAAGWVHDRPLDITAGRVALSTNSGFGGVNTAVILSGRQPA